MYESNQKRDLKQISIFKKILNRIQKRIQVTGRNKRNEKHIWFCVPEYIFGEPVYDNGECIAYVVTKLEENGFYVRYVHPNTLFVSWENWVPSYVRNEYKKKTGIVINEKGHVVSTGKEEDDTKAIEHGGKPATKDQKQYTPIDKYKPTGNLVYNPEMFEKIEKKIT